MQHTALNQPFCPIQALANRVHHTYSQSPPRSPTSPSALDGSYCSNLTVTLFGHLV
jgi:hypothetical protein